MVQFVQNHRYQDEQLTMLINQNEHHSGDHVDEVILQSNKYQQKIDFIAYQYKQLTHNLV
jgi:hypothetical protein